MERKVSLKGKSEWAGARKILRHLKNARMLKGKVKLEKARLPQRKNGPRGSSQYKDSYLNYNAYREAKGLKPVTPGTYLAQTLRGRAKQYAGGYERALRRALSDHQELGSAGGGTAYRRENPRRRNIAGFMGPDGVFHPIRSGERATYASKGKRVLRPAKTAYSRKKAGERARPKSRTKPARRRTAKKRNTTYTSFRAQGRRTKKQEFLRRMRLGKLRAARSRKR